MKAKDFKVVIEELKQRISPKSEQVQSKAQERKEFQSILWGNPVPYKQDTEWLKEVELELENVNIQGKVERTKEDDTMQLRNMPHWKATGQEGILEFWLKRSNSQHKTLTEELNENILSISISSWLLKRKTLLIQKDPANGNAVCNYQSKASLNLLWKFKTDIIADKIHQHLQNENLLLEGQKGCRHTSSDTYNQLLINKAVIRNFKRRKTNLNMTWIDFRKVYAIALYAWIIKALILIGQLSPNVIALLKSTIVHLKTKSISGHINLDEVNIDRRIFQGDSSSLLFIISVIPLTLALRRMKKGYSFEKDKRKLNHL